VYKQSVRRRRAVLALLVALSLILLTAYFGESAGGGLHALQRGVLQVLAPIQEGASRALKPFRDLAGWFGDTLNAKGDRDKLRKEIRTLRQRAIDDQAAIRENLQLKGLLQLDQSAQLNSYTRMTTRVIGRSPTVWYATINVDKGSSSGVRVNQPVVGSDGLVGKVTTVTPGASQVTLITDHTSGVSAKLNDTGVDGIVQPAVGDPNDLLLEFVARGSKVVKGEAVVTAGTRSARLESLFPPGIPIGTVTRVDDQELSLYQRVHIKPYSDLRKLDFVQILVRANGAGSQRAQLK
jgi:rod shape-determining protein MreC